MEAPIYSAKAHSQIVNAIDGIGGLGIGGGAPELVTGSRDGKSRKDARIVINYNEHKIVIIGFTALDKYISKFQQATTICWVEIEIFQV